MYSPICEKKKQESFPLMRKNAVYFNQKFYRVDL